MCVASYNGWAGCDEFDVDVVRELLKSSGQIFDSDIIPYFQTTMYQNLRFTLCGGGNPA